MTDHAHHHQDGTAHSATGHDHHDAHAQHAQPTAPDHEHHHGATPAAPMVPDTGGHAGHAGHGGHDHGAMVADFRRRFWITLVLTPPILILSPMIQHWLGLAGRIDFPGGDLLLFALSTFVYVYGGWPFLTGFLSEVRGRQPGMMTLIAMAITAAYGFSAATTFGFPGESFYWELATLIVIMLLGHWIEMRSVLGASRALEELVRLLPDSATRVRVDGSFEEVAISALVPGDRVVVRPGPRCRWTAASWRAPPASTRPC